MAEHGLGALLVSNPTDVRYLTGFTGEDSWLVVGVRQVWLICDARFDQEVDRSCGFVKKVLRDGPIVDALAGVVGDAKLDEIGFQADHLTVAARQTLGEKLGEGVLKPTRDWLVDQRSIKDADELRSIRRSIALLEQAYTQTLDQLRPGLSESEVVALLEYNMRWIGADGVGFATIVAIGANAAYPHHRPGRTRVKANTPILIDCGARADGYCSDMTRVVAMGGMSQKLREVYRIVREAQRAAIDAISPGRAMQEVDAAARTVIEQAGYGEYFAHGTGHGIGLDIHEKPVIGRRSKGHLAPGQVVTVEPGIYLPGVGGVRIEDDVLVTGKGHRKLTTLPSDAESAII
jgi:Xaa-Pro aminopeptidase